MRVTRFLGRLLGLAAALALAAPGIGTAQESHASFSLPPVNDLSAIVDRPLFSPERRPPPDDTNQTDQPVAAAESLAGERQLVLAGTATDQSKRAVAILHDLSQSIQFRVWVGDEVDGWTVKAIRPRALVLGTATQEVTVTLDEPAIPSPQ
jgi:general secretion pathway protein N